ncbi:MAG: glycosyltransferase [Candidatus Eremiobacteraeota bacterium]|nr:glycosyltransferase [Candidatus Eremiobacteraeota bacterium]
MSDRTTLFVPLWHPPRSGFAGGFYRARRILESLAHFDVIVADTDSSDIDPDRIPGVLIRIPAQRLYARRWPLFFLMRMVNWIWTAIGLTYIGLQQRSNLDGVYVPYSEVLPLTLAGFIVAKVCKIPLILCNLNVRETALWQLNVRFHSRADAVITISRALARELADSGVRAPILIGSVGVDDRSIPPVAEKRYDAIFVGRHTQAKGIFDLVNIWRLCCDIQPALRLAMIGACADHVAVQLAKRIEACGLRRNIDVLGAVSEERKWELYACSQLCVFPSKVEGWGIVPIEAHLAGLGVVAYRLPAYEETIAASPGARLVTLGDISAFARSVVSVLGDGVDQSATQAWARQFTWPSTVELEERLIASVVRSKAAH